MRAISQSQIGLFRNCPYGYELKYRWKKEPIMFDPSIMEVGKRVHDVIDIYYRNYYVTETDEQRILDTTYGVLRNQWDVTLPASYLKKAHTCLINFSKFEFNNCSNELATKPMTELKIYSGDLMGIIDYLDLSKPRAIDFKTNAKAYINHDYKMQATMYRKLIGEKFNVNINTFDFLFLYTDWEPKKVYLNNGELADIEKELYMYRDQIKEAWNTLTFPKKPLTESSCKSCSFRYYCGGLDGDVN